MTKNDRSSIGSLMFFIVAILAAAAPIAWGDDATDSSAELPTVTVTAEKRATSLEKLLVQRVEIKEAAPRITAHLGEIFGLVPRVCGRASLDALLQPFEERAALATA